MKFKNKLEASVFSRLAERLKKKELEQADISKITTLVGAWLSDKPCRKSKLKKYFTAHAESRGKIDVSIEVLRGALAIAFLSEGIRSLLGGSKKDARKMNTFCTKAMEGDFDETLKVFGGTSEPNSCT